MIYNDFRSQGFVAIAINLSQNMESVVKPYARQYTYTVLRDDGSAWGAYVQGGYIPLNYVIDPNGTVRYWAEGFDETAVRNTISQWLPVSHDVGAIKIMNLPTTLDSGTVVTPACSVFNYGSNTETYQVRMKIGTVYNNTATVTSHPASSAQYVTFPIWIAGPRGSKAVTCSTELAGDLRTGDDKVTGATLVQVYDAALIAILAPCDSVELGASVTPAIVLENHGSGALRVKVRCNIGSSYFDSASVTISGGRCDTANLPAWIAAPLGTLAVRCTAIVIKDLRPDDNLLLGSVRVVNSTGIEEPCSGVRVVALNRAVPNPTSEQTEISYALGRSSFVGLSIYSANGTLVRRLFAGYQPAGRYQQPWDGHDDRGLQVREGVYYCRLRASGSDAVLKLVKTR